MDTQVDKIFYLIILIISIVIHEIAHGYAALYYGDTTARDMGRLTLNPIKHIDPIGSIVVPLLLFFTGSPFMVGWAKPVPYNPNNLNNEKKGTLAVAMAGIAANLSIVIVFTLLIKLAGHYFSIHTLQVMALVVLVNLILALFNLLPVPPLDGSKIVASFGSRKLRDIVEYPRGITMIGFFLVAIILWNILSPFVLQIYNWLV
jgi:Zn-dependent protease